MKASQGLVGLFAIAILGIGERPTTLVVDLMQVRLDVTGASKSGDGVRLIDVIAAISGQSGRWPLEAMKAQAVAARSFFHAGGHHGGDEFCDTTHCQFLREPPAPGSAVAAAVAATRDLVLAYDSHPFAAMYTRSCSGRTRTPEEVGLSPSDYPYFSVECAHCRSHPVRWSSRMSAQDAASLHPSNESARLNIDRRLGWSVVPSNNFVAKTVGDQTIVEGTGQGHGIGLCQSGAKAMAEAGADFRQILSHYYPNTNIVSFPAGASFRTANAQ